MFDLRTITTQLPFGLFSSATLTSPLPKVKKKSAKPGRPVLDPDEEDDEENPKPFWED